MIEDVVIDPDESDMRVLALSVGRLADAFTLQIEEDRKARAAQAEKDRVDRHEQEKRLTRGRRQWYVFITSFMTVLLVAVIAFGTVDFLALQAANRAFRRVEDCSTPGGACYQQKSSTSLANIKATVEGVHGDTAAQLQALEQQICNLDAELCLPGLKPTPATTTTTPGR